MSPRPGRGRYPQVTASNCWLRNPEVGDSRMVLGNLRVFPSFSYTKKGKGSWQFRCPRAGRLTSFLQDLKGQAILIIPTMGSGLVFFSRVYRGWTNKRNLGSNYANGQLAQENLTINICFWEFPWWPRGLDSGLSLPRFRFRRPWSGTDIPQTAWYGQKTKTKKHLLLWVWKS